MYSSIFFWSTSCCLDIVYDFYERISRVVYGRLWAGECLNDGSGRCRHSSEKLVTRHAQSRRDKWPPVSTWCESFRAKILVSCCAALSTSLVTSTPRLTDLLRGSMIPFDLARIARDHCIDDEDLGSQQYLSDDEIQDLYPPLYSTDDIGGYMRDKVNHILNLSASIIQNPRRRHPLKGRGRQNFPNIAFMHHRLHHITLLKSRYLVKSSQLWIWEVVFLMTALALTKPPHYTVCSAIHFTREFTLISGAYSTAKITEQYLLAGGFFTVGPRALRNVSSNKWLERFWSL